MNLRPRMSRSMVLASLLFTAGMAGACATQPSGGVDGANAGGVGVDRDWAAYEAVDLQWRQAAVARAFLSRLDEAMAADANPQDPDHFAGYEEAARHMLARAEERLTMCGVTNFDGKTPEAEAVARADVRRVASEYASQAVSLQREVVRMERRMGMTFSGSGEEEAPAVTDLTMLLALRSPLVSVPLNTGNGGSASASGGGGAGTPKVVQSGTGGAAQPGQDSSADDASKRRGFATHPGYVPVDK